MMSPQVYADARAEAPIHVQLMRGGVRRQRQESGSVRVHGRVVRIFRDRERAVHLGQRLSFLIQIIDPDAVPMPSGEIRHDWDYLGRARFIEAFLTSWQGEIHLVRSQVLGIRYPTLRPVCPPDAPGFLCPGNL